MKIIFANPWAKSLFGDEKQASGYHHLGLAYLITVCKRNGYKDIKIFDQSIEKDNEILFRMLSTCKPDLIAITSYNYCYNYAQDLIENIKVRFPLITIIVGGPPISTTKGIF